MRIIMNKIALFYTTLAVFITNAQNLDHLAQKYGTDKSSCFHNYTKTYDYYFNALKDTPIILLEIGFAHGSSARMWEEYFSQGRLFFIDSELLLIQYTHGLNRSTFFCVNQENEEELKNFIAKTNTDFDIIIDDGGHTMNQQITSFKVLFPYVKNGGLYIIEDLHTSYPYLPNYAESYGCTIHSQTTIHFLQTLIDYVNLPGAKTGCADSQKYSYSDTIPVYAKNIETIHFYPSLCVIKKK